ncbi:methyltransferase domain-containing protein [Streptomyces sp. NPDC056796]|uniref:methyltransferase domain-containing protein n=1 Tax=unclassified Streptomyces TaxID=2593676 RepID=UPI003699E7FC
MTPTLVRHHRHADPSAPVDAGTRARDWAEIQERMLAPLYEAVYERLDVGGGTRMLSLGCGSGLALLMAASRGARVTGVDTDPERLGLARERLAAGPWRDAGRDGADPRARVVDGVAAAAPADGAPYNLLTAFQPIGCAAGDAEGLAPELASAVPLAVRGATVVLTGWGPPERCATAPVLGVAARLTGSARAPRSGSGTLRDGLEETAARAGLRPDGSGRVSCPFGYADVDSAVRGLLSTGLFDAAVGATDRTQVEKEVEEALHPHLRPDGTVWMPNVFRYLVCVP